MKMQPAEIAALEALGYTEQEARFLYLVATHSGYFVGRQFLGFAGVKWGARSTLLWNKLRSRKHVRTSPLPNKGAVHHLFARKLYRQIGREHLTNRHRHELDYVRARIAILDFVLSHPDLPYLETEADKLAFFCGQWKVEKHHLPSKTYAGRGKVPFTVRYFADGFPMFLNDPNPEVVTFTFIQGPEANLATFARHLRSYLPLFLELAEFRFLYLARLAAHFDRARELFRSHVEVPLESNPAEDLLRYFRIRQAWDSHEFGSLSEQDLIFRNVAKERFAGDRFENFYRGWRAGRLGEADLRAQFQGSSAAHQVQFECQVLKLLSAPAKGEA